MFRFRKIKIALIISAIFIVCQVELEGTRPCAFSALYQSVEKSLSAKSHRIAHDLKIAFCILIFNCLVQR